jgi:ribonuclease P protein component
MIRRAHRFHGYNSLNFVYRQGRTVRGPLCSLKYVENDRHETYRTAVIVSKKVSKSAVVRNRIRRRIYEAVRELGPKITKPYDLVFTIFSDNVAEMEYSELHRAIRAQLRQAGVVEE